MSQDDHVRAQHYVLTRTGRVGKGGFALQVHEHLVQACPDCRKAWSLLGEGQEEFRELLLDVHRAAPRQDSETGGPPRHHLSAYSAEVRGLEEEVARLRNARGEAAKRCWELLQLSPDQRPARVRRARTRFRSRFDAEYMLGKARECIREDPREAESLAATARLIVQHIPGAAGTPWGAGLEARATAWQANALRVAGDLSAASEMFVRLRRSLATAPLDDAAIVGEVASLEASLRTDQRRFDEARHLLDLALLVATLTAERRLEIKVLLKRGNLEAVQGHDEDALHDFQQATATMEEADEGEVDPLLWLAAVNGRIFSLCDLGEARAARRLLDDHIPLYRAADDLYCGAVLTYHRGRIALGMDEMGPAIHHLREARQLFLRLHRIYDALLVTLDLALALARDGRTAELRAMAEKLVPLFSSRHVSREALAALKLLVDAIHQEELSADLLAGLRTRLRQEATQLTEPSDPHP